MKDIQIQTVKVVLYFIFWIILACFAVILNILNMDWRHTDKVNGFVIILVLGVIQGCVLEFPVQTVFTLARREDVKRIKVDDADIRDISLILNYNLLATSKEDVRECMQTMYTAYMGNLAPKIAAVLVSATNEEHLRNYELELRDYYRGLIYDELYNEGICLARSNYPRIHKLRFLNVWKFYRNVNPAFFTSRYLHGVCLKFSKNFMVIHRVSRVLRKCGQYQDLMLLSEGSNFAFTYCDTALYGQNSRCLNEPLFLKSADVDNIIGRKFDYTLVLDADTSLPEAAAEKLLKIAAANPNRGIIQPAIKLACHKCDTIFMHLESLRQNMAESITNAMANLFRQSSFYGKALIQNDMYINTIMYKGEELFERVPVNVLSHDTFEASILRPLYADSVFVLEAPPFNYVTWNIRERRWNSGEILNAMFFWPTVIGGPLKFLQKTVQGKKFVNTHLRTKSYINFISSYLAHAALRQMCVKPLLLLYIVLHINVSLHYPYIPICIILVLVIIFPKLAMCNSQNFKFVIIEIVASVLQFTPEAVVGCVRILRAFHATIFLGVEWVPQSSVENEFKRKNAFVSAFKHLWGYSLIGLICTILIIVLDKHKDSSFLFIILGSLILLPVFTGITSLPVGRLGRYRGTVGVDSHMAPPNHYRAEDIVCPSRLHFQRENTMYAWNEPSNHDFSIV